tara:strand:- start:833 stop:1087 length:255 start_codon:yes stop_codon:yes gene_type:complete
MKEIEMKVGDIVRQNGSLVQTKGRSLNVNTERTGMVIEIKIKDRNWPEKFSAWQKYLGRSITVLWSNGKVNTIAENGLEIADEK